MSEVQQGDIRIDPQRLMQILSLDLYPEITVFARELLQNADDAGAKELSFSVRASEIVVENSGKEFNEKDIERITSFGFGKEDPDLIGTFGIGFRSVYRITDYPKIVSGNHALLNE